MSRYSSILFLILILKAIVLGWYISQGFVGLGPDEAQYWTWSRNLDWGFYSKPPGIAFQIAFGTSIFGNNELGVRFGSLLLGTLMPIGVYFMALRGGLSQAIAFWSALILALSPLGIMSTLFAITDVGMAFAWIMAALFVFVPLSRQKKPNYFYAGLIIAFGALFKWPIYFFWAVVAVGMVFIQELRSRSLIPGVAVSLLGFLPPLIWNIQHDWVTFRHVGITMIGGHGTETGTTALMRGNVLEFIGAQALLLSPIIFVVLICGWILAKKLWSSSPLPVLIRWGALSSFLIVAGFTFVAFVQKMQGNWCVFAYLLAFPLVAWTSLKWTKVGAIFSTVLVCILLSIPILQESHWVRLRWSPFKHNVGWEEISPTLSKVGYQPDKHFLFGETYQMTSLLNFYAPMQKKAYFLNLEGARHNQFDLWPGMREEQLGKDGYFVQIEYKLHEAICDKKKQKQLEKYFNKVECLGVYPLFPTISKFARIWFCEGYNGKVPFENTKY